MLTTYHHENINCSQSKLERLNAIVWPEIWRLAQEKIQEAHSKGFGVCVVDAAVMLKAGWNKHVHEIWVTIVPEKEVIFFPGNVGLIRVCLLINYQHH